MGPKSTWAGSIPRLRIVLGIVATTLPALTGYPFAEVCTLFVRCVQK